MKNTFSFTYPIASCHKGKFTHQFNLIVTCAYYHRFTHVHEQKIISIKKELSQIVSIKYEGGQDELLPVISLLTTEMPCIIAAAENNLENLIVSNGN